MGTKALVASIDWHSLDQAEAARLRHFGFDEGVAVEPLHLGPFGRDPIAIRVGRMTVAIRRKHAGAVRVAPIA
jgi:ferrous iron transport protein A